MSCTSRIRQNVRPQVCFLKDDKQKEDDKPRIGVLRKGSFIFHPYLAVTLTVVLDRLRRFKYPSRGRIFFSTASGCEDVRNTPLILRRKELPR